MFHWQGNQARSHQCKESPLPPAMASGPTHARNSLKEEFSTGRQILWPGRQVLCQHLCAHGSIIPKRRQVGRRRTRTCLPCQLTFEPLTGLHPQHVALNQSAAAMRGEGKVSDLGLGNPGGCHMFVNEVRHALLRFGKDDRSTAPHSEILPNLIFISREASRGWKRLGEMASTFSAENGHV